MKSASFGVKNPVESKEARIQNNKRYYPQIKQTGGYDEWAAVNDGNYETATKLRNMMDRDKRELLTNEYGFTQYQEGLNQVQQAKD